MTTPAIDKFLKAILETHDETGRATTCTLAKRLEISPASVTQMAQRLSDNGLVVYAPYRGISLTSKGEEKAVALSRKHEIIKQFLIQKLGFDHTNAHSEAERLVHIVSSRLLDKMDVIRI
jgi:DtxR family Mn-dependent transcriptional regulator